jgi:MGT family glycosyltransferase
MARLLVATVPLTGHIHPMLPIVSELASRGHELVWTTGTKFAPRVRATGAAHVAMSSDWDDADLERAFPELRGVRGFARVKLQLRKMFIEPIAGQLADLEALHRANPADAVVSDSAHLGAGLFAEKHGLPWIELGISALMLPSRDTAPFGSALPPALGSRFLNWLIFRVLFGSVNRAYRRARVAVGMPAGSRMYFEVMSDELFLQPTVAELEYPRSDLPSQVAFIGPLLPPPGDARLPTWWPEVEAAHAAGRPIILVTQGTLATDPSELIEPALAALADRDALVIVTLDRALAVPSNARIAAYVPYQALLPYCRAMITNGGYGGVQMAIAHGVPLIIAGGSEEKPEIAARVAWAGAAIDLRTGRPKPAKLRKAIDRILVEPSFRARAEALQRVMATCDAPKRAAELVAATLAAARPASATERQAHAS